MKYELPGVSWRMGKKRNEPSSSSSSSGEEQDMSDVEVTFELFNMDLCDYHPVRLLLQQAFFMQRVEVGSVAELITEELSEYIGTCVKQFAGDENDEALGFVTLVPLYHKAAKGLLSFFGKHFDFPEKTGVLLMERMMNMPCDLAKPLYLQLLDDYMEAIAENKDLFVIDQVLIYTPFYWEVDSEVDDNKAKKKQRAESGPFYYQEEIEGLISGKTVDIVMHNDEYTADSKRAFSERGIRQGRRMAMVSWNEFVKFIRNL